MIWKKERFKPTQPYFVIDTAEFRQKIYLQHGISHFYTFKVQKNTKRRTVPDACIDLFFEYKQNSMKGYVYGTRPEYTTEEWDDSKEVFGVRFMPGVHPALLNIKMVDVLNERKAIEDVITGDSKWLDEIAKEQNFHQRIRIFLEAYIKAEKTRDVPYGKKKLIQSVKTMVYQTDGTIKISEISANTGYTERYINQVFLEQMGFSPKTFCKIIQFQRVLEFLNYGAPDSMTEAAVYWGYYDQSQFIRDFTRYAGITPHRYLKLIQSTDYKNRINRTYE